jgi:hypothetical protein
MTFCVYVAGVETGQCVGPGGDAPYYRIRDYNVTGVSPLDRVQIAIPLAIMIPILARLQKLRIYVSEGSVCRNGPTPTGSIKLGSKSHGQQPSIAAFFFDMEPEGLDL